MYTDQELVQQRNVEVDTQEKILVRSYGTYLKHTLKELRLGGIKVSDQVEERDASFFNDRLTLGISGLADNSVAIVASSETPDVLNRGRMSISTLLIVPREDGLPLYVDQADGTMWSDFFYVCEGGVFKPVRTSRPIPIDGFYPMYDSKRDFEAVQELLPMNVRLFEVTDDKWKTREVLAEAGISVPRGDLITQGEISSTRDKIGNFVRNNPDLKGVVIKGNGGSGGTLVQMFATDAIDEAETYARGLLQGGYDVIVEERIMPLQVPIKSKFGVELKGDEVDYNLRVLVTLGEAPEVIDSEIRYHLIRRGKPINIHQGAKAVRPEKVLDYKTIVDVEILAERATQRLQEVASDGRSRETGFVGIDIIIDENGRLYVIEANSGAVGGFSTLCKLDRKPLASVAETLIPSARPFLTDNFRRRKSHGELRPLPLSTNNYNELGSIYFGNKDYARAQRFLTEALERSPDYAPTLHNMALVNLHTKQYQEALEYFQRAWEADSDFVYNAAGIGRCLRILGRHREAIDFLDECIANGKVNQLVLMERAALEIVTSGDSNAARAIVRQYQDIDFDQQWHKTAEYGLMVGVYRLLGDNIRATLFLSQFFGRKFAYVIPTLSQEIFIILQEDLKRRLKQY